MAEIITYKGIKIKIYSLPVSSNSRLDFKLLNSEGNEIPFVKQVSVVNYSQNHKDRLIEDACKEIDILIQEGRV
ncbi:hypothetical protein [Scytonema sp. UIC 10036]|uniref:hypothetical protein n=1 Tax=Scytonema sp. UIC 10036 TaxID=2304196 RepID=UPI001A9BC427|nr:hypothetical protein [Scytonema sp. UIC 10036]